MNLEQTKTITELAVRYKLEPALVGAVIKVESSGVPWSPSAKSACR